MTIAYWCLLCMIIFPYIFTVLAKTGPGFTNHNPREYLEQLKGWRKRAHWVQLNSFEGFPAFAIAILVAELLHASQMLVNTLALSYLVARILYAACYLADKAILRTFFWLIGFACVIALYCSPLQKITL